jgi:hypothetical protein
MAQYSADERSDSAQFLADVEEHAGFETNFGLSLASSFFKPRCRLDIILSDTEALVKQESETGLRWGIAALGQWVPGAKRADVVAAVIR